MGVKHLPLRALEVHQLGWVALVEGPAVERVRQVPRTDAVNAALLAEVEASRGIALACAPLVVVKRLFLPALELQRASVLEAYEVTVTVVGMGGQQPRCGARHLARLARRSAKVRLSTLYAEAGQRGGVEVIPVGASNWITGSQV